MKGVPPVFLHCAWSPGSVSLDNQPFKQRSRFQPRPFLAFCRRGPSWLLGLPMPRHHPHTHPAAVTCGCSFLCSLGHFPLVDGFSIFQSPGGNHLSPDVSPFFCPW